MPETATFQGSSSPTKINWLYVGGGVFALVAVMYLLTRNSKGAGGTVAAGTSINAALGSLQESALNQQGALSLAQTSISTLQGTQDTSFSNLNDVISSGIGGVNQNIAAAANSINSNISTGNSGITQLISNDMAGINTQLGSILGQEATTYTYLQNAQAQMVQAFGANSAQVGGINAEIQSIFNEMEAGFKDLANQLNKPVAVQSPGGSGGSGGGGLVHTYTVFLPGGGEIHTNSTSAAAALNNVPGGHF